jgi:hypothetical protein
VTARLSGGYRSDHFEVDGALRDVCVPDAGLPVWERLLRAVADSSWEYRLEVDGEPCPAANFSVADFFAVPDDVDVSARLAIRVGELWFVTFFFEVPEIEFTFDPAHVTGGERFGELERFMVWLADACERRVVMTMETSSGHQGMPALLETL